ncbi:MAG: hypothetical protein CME55_02890 [Halieaceae bacterium]|nr:hypothetical protein [Halieaceae bacterium]
MKHLNVLSRRLLNRVLTRSDNPVLHLASEHRSRPTPLKDALLLLETDAASLLEYSIEASHLLERFPSMAADVELATLRACSTKHPAELPTIVKAFPSLRNDPRARSLLERVEAERTGIDAGDTALMDVLGKGGNEALMTIEGIISACTDRQRTLNDVRSLIQLDLMVRSRDSIHVYYDALESLICTSDEKSARQFYVAALRELGELDAELGVKFGGLFDERLADQRGTRSYIIFLNRVGDTMSAIKLLEKGTIGDVEWVSETLSRLREKEEMRMLEATFTSNLDAALQGGLESLAQYMNGAYLESSRKKELAHVFFRFVHPMYKEERSEASAKLAIYWGQRILDHAKISNTIAIHVSNAYITLGDIRAALNALEVHGSPNSEKILDKISGLQGLLSLHEHGFKPADLPVVPENFTPAPNRILYLLHNSLPFNSGGYAARAHGLMRGVAELGWDVHVVTRAGYPHDRGILPEDGHPDMEIIDGITYHRMYELEEGYGQVRLLRYFEVYQHHLARKVIELQPSVIHAASNHLNGLVGNAVAAHFNLPSIYEVRGLWEITRISRQPAFEDSTYFQMMAKMETQACREATGCLAITRGLIDEINRRLEQPRAVGYLPNGVEIDRFSPRGPDGALRAQLGFPPEAVIIGYIGSVVSYEGLDLLMEALPEVKAATNTPFRVLIVGDGAYMHRVKDACKANDLEDVVTFTGRVPHEEVEAYYSLVDIAPFPRLPQPVTELVSPLKPFEAMAMEKAVIASDVHALTEIVQHEHTGLLFEKGNASSLADALLRFIDDRELRTECGSKARIWVEEERDWSSISLTLDSTYKTLVR